MRQAGEPRILVTDPRQRMAFLAAHVLRGDGFDVVALDDGRDAQATRRSRAFSEWHDVPSSDDPESWARAVIEVARDGDVLFPVMIPSLLAAASTREALAVRLRVAGGTVAGVKQAADKAATLRIAKGLGIDVPRGYTLEEALREAPRRLFLKRVSEVGFSPHERYRLVNTGEEVETAHQELGGADGAELLIQEHVSGCGVGYSALLDRGRPLLEFCHRRLREAMPDGGPSTYCEPFDLAQLEEQSRTLMRHLQLSGFAMVEYKWNPETGALVLMEVNPRLWGSFMLGVINGACFPIAYVRWVLGRPPGPCQHEAGVHARRRMKYLPGDVFAMARQLKRVPAWRKPGFVLRFAGEFLDARLRIGDFPRRDWRMTLDEVLTPLYRKAGRR